MKVGLLFGLSCQHRFIRFTNMGSPTSLGMVGRNGGVSCWRTLNTTAVTKCKKDIIRGKIKKSGRVSGKADGYPIH